MAFLSGGMSMKHRKKRSQSWGRRGISLLLSMCILLSLLPVQVMAAGTEDDQRRVHSFADVLSGSWYEEAVQYVYEHGVFSGTGSTTFEPDGTMTRGMFVTVLGHMAGVNTDNYQGESPFSDVPAAQYYAPYVAWAAKHGITGGTGDGKFSPDALVTRQQMATFFVHYFEAFGVDYDTGANITTSPADLDRVADYARDPVLKLWRAGLLSGDGVNFNPEGTATRAQAAALCMNTHQAVKTWYQEPGIPSGAETPSQPEKKPTGGGSSSSGGSSGGSSSGGSSSTRYYEVTFAAGDGINEDGLTLPESATYPSGTSISDLPTPYQRGYVFLGWYYDQALQDRVESVDTVGKNMTLYAKMTELDEVPFEKTPPYITKRDVGTGFTFQVQAASIDEVQKALTVSQVTANNERLTQDTDYTISGNGDGTYIVSGPWDDGHTYRAKLDEDSDVWFVSDGQPQPDSVREMNFLTAKEEVLNLSLRDGLIYIPKQDVSAMSSDLAGLFSVDLNSPEVVQTVANSGTFTYHGGSETIAVGDTVAIYEGVKPDARSLATDNDGTVVYVNITAVNDGTYTYTTADSKDVLFTPDVLPVLTNADTDEVDGQITVDKSVMDYSDDKYDEMGLSAQTTVDVGDFIAFYTGDMETESGSLDGYARIKDVRDVDDTYVIAYEAVSQADVLASMDIYHTRTESVEMTPSEISAMEADIVAQAEESGFIDEAMDYLTYMALTGEDLENMDGVEIVNYSVQYSDPASPAMRAFSAKDWNREWEIKKQNVSASIKVGKGVLEHFEESDGLRAELKLEFEKEIEIANGNKLTISMEAVFEQEVLLSINVSGGAIWKWAWIIPYIYDYQLNANIDVGTFTGIAVTASMITGEADDDEEGEDEDDDDNAGNGSFLDVDWSSLIDFDQDVDDYAENLGKQLDTLIGKGEEFMEEHADAEEEDEEEDEEHPLSGLMEQYAEMMGEADDSWIELVRKEIFKLEGSIDPFHILVYGIGADFVVQANIYITLGMTFEYGNAKRYNFSLMLFHKQSTNETIDLETAHYEFIFYVMGTLGIKAGVEFEIAVGLISLKLDSIGITAEVGAYAQLWGFFYYKLSWEEGSDEESICAGALHIEIGIYLEIKFKAQLFSSEKLTYNPTLYENQWPIYTIGEQEYVYAFNWSPGEEDDAEAEGPAYEYQSVRRFSLPTELFDMAYMDMQSGDLCGVDAEDEEENPAANFDDKTESRFTIELSNPKFSYAPDGNIITIDPGESVEESCEMTIIWKGGTLAFTSQPITLTVTIAWSDPANARYIAFESNGGSVVKMLSKAVGASITAPAAPTKQGYDFAGWYTAEGASFTVPATMPDYPEPDKGITVYAKWTPRHDTPYQVEYYLQELNGSYTLAASTRFTGTTDASVTVDTDAPEGFTYNAKKSTTDQTIAPNGSTVVKLYFSRNQYDLTFTYGDKGDGSLPNVVYRDVKYGAAIYEPKMNLGGYLFNGWEGGVIFTDADGNPTQTMPAGDTTYAATWKPDPNISYRVEYYIQDAVEDKWYYDSARIGTGATDSLVPLSDYTTPGDGLVFHDRATVKGTPVQAGSELLKIKGDGSLVIKVYLDRTTHTVTFETDGGSSVDDQTVRDTGKVALPTAPTKVGYTFAKWTYQDANGQTVDWDFANGTVTGDLTLTAQWIPKGDTAYKVEHWWQNTTDDPNADLTTDPFANYTLHESVPMTGTTGEMTTAEAKTYDGFQAAREFAQTTIAADGSTVIKIYYDRETYEVSFSHDGTSEPIAAQTIRYGGTVTEPTAPTKAGYVLNHWQTSDGTAWKFAENTVTGTLTLTAQWRAGSDTAYTVKHYLQNLDGTYPTEPEATEPCTGTTGADAVVTLKQYEGFGSGTYASEVIAADGSTVVEVRYPRNSYTVTWYDWDGTTELGSGKFKYGETITVPDTVKKPSRRTGYTFASWKDAGTMPAANKTITASEESAHWTANTYTVTFNANGGTGSMENQVYIYDAEQTLTANAFSKNGYEFAGWNTQPDGSGTLYTDAQTVSNLTAENNGTVTLYAQWTMGDYTISYDLAGGTLDTQNSASYHVESESFTLNNPTRTGYTFAGWTGTGLDNAMVNVTVPKGSTGNRSYTATWTANTYTVTFDYNDEGASTVTTVPQTYDSYYELPETPTRTGYAFTGWYTAAEGGTLVESNTIMTVTEAHTLYAHWEYGTATPYTVKHLQQDVSGNGYTEVESDRQNSTGTTNGTTNAQAKTYTGFTAQAFEQETILADGSTVVEIFYDRNSYTVTWVVDGESTDEEYLYGAVISKRAEPNKDLYTFIEWSGYTDDMTMGAENVTFTAQWTEATYSVTLHDNGGTAGELTHYTYGTGATLPTPIRTGYTFGGWYDNESCTGTPVTEISTTDSGNKEFWARWTANAYTVIFEANGGTGSMDSQHFTYDEAQALTANTFTKRGYTFCGWNTEEHGTGTAYGDGAEVSNLVSEDGASFTLYAQWTVNTYAISYVEANDIGGRSSYTYSATEDIAFQIGTPQKDNHTLTGWTCSPATVTVTESDGQYTVTIPADTAEDITITANWKQNSITLFDPNGNLLDELSEGTALSDTVNYTDNGTTVSNAVVAYWQVPNTDTHYCNGKMASYLTGQGVTALQAVLMDAEHPMEIDFITQLDKIVTNSWLNGHYKLVADITLNSNWKGIGTDTSNTTAFTGTFDGNGHTITYDQDFMPEHSLFNYANGATIKNLTVTGYLTSSDIYIGGIVGYATNSLIENCTVTGNVRISTSRAADNNNYGHLGGIVGYLDGTSTLSGCKVEGTEAVPAVIKAENLYKSYLGGIVGYVNVNTEFLENEPLEGNILNCHVSYANITATTYAGSGYSSGEANTGGLAGSVIANGSVAISGCTVSNATCTSAANKSGFYACTAGIAGYASAQWKSSGTAVLLIDQCTVDGNFTATGDDSYTFAAMAIGKLGLKEDRPYSVTISNYSVNGATVTKNGSTSDYLIGDPATQAGDNTVTLVPDNAS